MAMMRLPYFLAFFFLSFIPVLCGLIPAVFSEEETVLEGIMYEESRPSESIASINGVLLKRGDDYRGCTVSEILQDRVVIRCGDSDQVLSVKSGGKPKKPAAAQKQMAAEEKKESPKTSIDDVMKKVNDLMGGQGTVSSPKQLMDKVNAMQVVMNLRLIRQQISVYKMTNGSEPSISELVKQSAISMTEDGISGDYRYYIKEGNVHADPNSSKPGLSFYMITGAGVIHVEPNGPPQDKSPVYSG